MARRKPKRLKTGDEPNEEVVVLKVRVKVESDDNKEEESSDNDANEEEEEEEQPEQQPAQPVAQIKRPAYVALRPDGLQQEHVRNSDSQQQND
jgi:hypothetical protein